MRFLTRALSADDASARELVGRTMAESRNGARITSHVFPDHEGRVLAARRVYLATLDETPALPSTPRPAA